MMEPYDKYKTKRDPIQTALFFLIGCLLISIVVVALVGGRKKESAFKMNLKGKSWISYGDSITDGGFWQEAVYSTFHLQHTDLGISGTCVSGPSEQAFWSEQRIAAIVEKKPDVLSILGGTNDFFSGYPIGDRSELEKKLSEKNTNTFMGAYAYLIERLMSEIPNLQIIIITTPLNFTFFEEDQSFAGVSIQDYADASAEIAAYYSLHLSDLRDIPYTKETFTNDFWDGVHPNLEGCAKISERVIQTLHKLEGQ